MNFSFVAVLIFLVTGLAHAYIDDIIKNAAPNHAAFEMKSDGTVRVEYDILYTKEQWDEIQARKNGTHVKRKAEPREEYRWTNNVIPYEIASGEFSWEAQSMITDAMRTWEKYVCITFRPRLSSDDAYVHITKHGGCSSFVGMMYYQPQQLTLGDNCLIPSVIMHELGHAIGFEHEQCRSDRDSYISVQLDNVYPDARYNFDLKQTDNRNIAYDYGSIMQYGQYAFSSNGQRTILTYDAAWQQKIGTAYMLSYADVKLANAIYNCGARCSSCSHYGDAYADKNCNCRCPGTPAKICGTSGGDDGLEGCVDTDTECEKWAALGRCETYPDATLVTCPKSCGCGDVSRSVCRDVDASCGYYEQLGECESMQDWMHSYCRKSCGVCGTEEDRGSCVDNNDGCEDWAKYGECDKNPGYMHENCAKSCGKC